MAPYRRLLVANRGEIALRVIRTCREKGIETVAVYSEADRGSLHVEHADASCCVGGTDARDSYMNVPNIICAALQLEAEAVHPGYGFLSEDARFARICEAHRLEFVGPAAGALELAGDKVLARERASSCEVPVLPAFSRISSVPGARDGALRVGYPLVAKPRGGGGGRGIMRAADEGALEGLLSDRTFRRSVEKGEYFLERCLERPRHIEVQLLADRAGGVRVAGLRDCSIQNNRQKIIEEAPPVHIPRGARNRISEAAVRVCRALGFTTVGTAEFLVDGDSFYFLEFNPRIQVEHTVTEMETGLDLVWEQIRLSAGEHLEGPEAAGPKGAHHSARGHAMQARVYAELPGDTSGHAGNLRTFRFPGGPGVRVDTHLCPGCAVPYVYDPLLAKVITWASTRAGAIQRMRGALAEVRVEGVETNLPLLRAVVESREFRHGHYDTGLVESIRPGPGAGETAAAAGVVNLRPCEALSS